MKTLYVTVTAPDPLIARDSRPFGANQGLRMRGLPWLLPSVVAGSLRTTLVKVNPALDFAFDGLGKLRAQQVAGALPCDGDRLYLPAPADAVCDRQTLWRIQPQPLRPDEGMDLPSPTLQPVMLGEDQAEEGFKPTRLPAWWPLEKYVEWLVEPAMRRPAAWLDGSFCEAALQELRTHVKIEPGRGTAQENMLFSTANLYTHALPRFGSIDGGEKHPGAYVPVTLAVRLRAEPDRFGHATTLRAWHPLGGERRLVHWDAQGTASHEALWKCPDRVREALPAATHVRMILATPAIFAGGWKPGWIDETLAGSPPGANVRVRLVGVAIERWRAVSGWSLAPINDRGELDRNGRPGPRPIRRYVPAGGTYFFEVLDGEPATLGNLWLEPLSDDAQDRADGFGLAVWGIWQSAA